jgi:hypothetical protein
MKFKNLIHDLIVEEVKNKNLFNKLYNLWKESIPNLTLNDAETIFNRHDNIKDVLKNPNTPAVISFLTRHDGQHGSKKYELKQLTDITQFNIFDLIEILTEYGKFNLENDYGNGGNEKNHLNKIFSENGNKKTNEKIEESKRMWFDPSSAKISEDGFRVYEILNQVQSMRMGYYMQEVHKIPYVKFRNSGESFNMPWCVTWRGNEAVEYVSYDENGRGVGAPLYTQSSNMYGTYRRQGKTFYFVIDESKDTTNKYYMSALQARDNGAYILTSLYNDGDQSMTWEEIVNIYPKIANHKDKIAPRQMSDSELETRTIVDVINENEGSPQEFARQVRTRKQEYISNGGYISKIKSWGSMDSELRTLYVDMTTVDNAFQRYGNLDLFKEMVNTPGFRNKIERRLKILGKSGISYIIDELLKRQYERLRTGIKNKNIALFQNRSTRKIGLYNYATNDWLSQGSVVYVDNYTKGDEELYFDDQMEGYLVEPYFITNVDDLTSFFSVSPSSELTSDENNDFPTHFISGEKWKELSQRLTPEDEIEKDEMGVGKFKDLEPESDFDIKELY